MMPSKPGSWCSETLRLCLGRTQGGRKPRNVKKRKKKKNGGGRKRNITGRVISENWEEKR